MLKRCSVNLLISRHAFKLHDHSLLANASHWILSQIFAIGLLYSASECKLFNNLPPNSLTNSLFEIEVLNVHFIAE